LGQDYVVFSIKYAEGVLRIVAVQDDKRVVFESLMAKENICAPREATVIESKHSLVQYLDRWNEEADQQFETDILEANLVPDIRASHDLPAIEDRLPEADLVPDNEN
jgi:hypothetical protein